MDEVLPLFRLLSYEENILVDISVYALQMRKRDHSKHATQRPLRGGVFEVGDSM